MAWIHRWPRTVWIQDPGGTKLDNSFTELINYAITHHYPTLEFLSTTGRTTFVEDMIRSKGQANAQVSFEAAKRAPLCHTPGSAFVLNV